MVIAIYISTMASKLKVALWAPAIAEAIVDDVFVLFKGEDASQIQYALT